MKAERGPEADMPERRRFLTTLVRGGGAAVVAGVAWAGFLDGKKAYPFILRPPGAVNEQEFLARCTKCGICAAACPFRALIIASPGDGRPIGTPYFNMRENPCRMCRDVPCAEACPTGALDAALLSGPGEDGPERLDVKKSRIGIAVIDRETCIAYWGIQCDACYRSCPFIDKALFVEAVRNERTGKHAIFAPVVSGDHCTGCGMCERACITEKASIFVLPLEFAKGKSSARYIRGWREEDEDLLRELPEQQETVTPRSERDALDYLNRGEL